MSASIALSQKKKAIHAPANAVQTIAVAKPFTKQQLADLLNVSPRFIEMQVAKGALRRVKLSNHCVRFRVADVEAWMDAATGTEGGDE